MTPEDKNFMRRALELARQAEASGEVPVGAVLVADGAVAGEGANCPIASHDPTAHAEIVALRDATRSASNYRIPGSTMYITLEPCPMCLGAMVHARVKRVVFGAHDPKTGALGGACDLSDSEAFKHDFAVEAGCLAEESSQMLKDFFAARR